MQIAMEASKYRPLGYLCQPIVGHVIRGDADPAIRPVMSRPPRTYWRHCD